MTYDSEQVADAIEKMREALAILDRAGAGSTGFAFHLSLAVDVADDRGGAGVNLVHEFASADASDADV